jgi:hypothetical protein
MLLPAVVLGLATLMCSPPRDGISPAPTTEAEAVATSARQTAVSNVQRLLSGDAVATATPAPEVTPTPQTTCPDAIWWYEARAHIGESRVIEGTILRVRPAPDASMLLEIGQPYPDPTGFSVLVPADAAPALAGKTVCVQGRIVSMLGSPAIVEQDPATIKVLN